MRARACAPKPHGKPVARKTPLLTRTEIPLYMRSMSIARILANRLIVACLALALMVVGLGHQHATATPSDPMLAAYLEMGGSLDELCIESTDAGRGMAQDCPVCTLAQSMALSPDAPELTACARITRVDPPRLSAPLAHGHTPRAPPARGPPAILV